MDELVDRLRKKAKGFPKTGEVNPLLLAAADAIEELSAIRDEQKAQIILMAAEIEDQKTYAELYQSLTDKSKKTARNLLDTYPKWIPVTERLPELHTNVLVMDKAHDMAVGSLEKLWDGEVWVCPFADVEDEQCPVTHWMQLPQPPKEE